MQHVHYHLFTIIIRELKSSTHSLEHCNLLHSDSSLVFGSHVGKHVGSKPRKTCIIIHMTAPELQSHFIGKTDNTNVNLSIIIN